jgi:hypothetical protein
LSGEADRLCQHEVGDRLGVGPGIIGEPPPLLGQRKNIRMIIEP